MNLEYRKAFTEIYEIFKLMPKELLDRIPSKFYELIEEERDREYSISVSEPLENEVFKDETIVILGLIYRDFLCSPEERKKLQVKDAKELQEIQKRLESEMRQKYNPEEVFKSKNIKIKEQNEELGLIVIQEQKWYKKILDLVKGLFSKIK